MHNLPRATHPKSGKNNRPERNASALQVNGGRSSFEIRKGDGIKRELPSRISRAGFQKGNDNIGGRIKGMVEKIEGAEFAMFTMRVPLLRSTRF